MTVDLDPILEALRAEGIAAEDTMLGPTYAPTIIVHAPDDESVWLQIEEEEDVITERYGFDSALSDPDPTYLVCWYDDAHPQGNIVASDITEVSHVVDYVRGFVRSRS
jgi:hypothetical protein